MFTRGITLSAIMFLISCSMGTSPNSTNGFDSACQIFKEASTKTLNPEELGNHIATKLDNMEDQFASKEVKEVYHALFNVSPNQRYKLFKQSAETTLKRNWHCQVMKDLYGS